MQVNKSILNGIALIAYTALFALYLHRLTGGTIIGVDAKRMYYVFTSAFLLWLIIDEVTGYQTDVNMQFNWVNKFSLLGNFIIISLTLNAIILSPLVWFYSYNGLIFAATIPILISGGRHGYFDK